MNEIADFLPLLAAAAPILVIAVMNVCLALQGERDTLLFPSLRAFPTHEPAELADVPGTVTVPAAIAHCANDELAREAA